MQSLNCTINLITGPFLLQCQNVCYYEELFLWNVSRECPSLRFGSLCWSVEAWKIKVRAPKWKGRKEEGGQAGVSLGRRRERRKEGRKKFMEVRNCQENLAQRSNIVTRCGQSSTLRTGNVKVAFSSFVEICGNCMCSFSTMWHFITKEGYIHGNHCHCSNQSMSAADAGGLANK